MIAPLRAAVTETARFTNAVALITAAMAAERVQVDEALVRSLARLAAKAARHAARVDEYCEVAS